MKVQGAKTPFKSFTQVVSTTARASIFVLALLNAACSGGGEGDASASSTTSSISSGSSPSGSAPSTLNALSVNLDGSGSVTSSPSGISCGSDCYQTYSPSTTVTLTATPSAEYEINSWSVNGVSCGGPTCIVPMSASRAVTVNFTRRWVPLTISISGAGRVTGTASGTLEIDCGADCTNQYVTGSVVTLTATPTAGYTFSGWSGSGISCPGTGSCSVTMSAARTVSATFSPAAATTYLLQVNRSGSGSVSSSPSGISCGSDCSQSYNSGTSVTLSAAPTAGYVFTGWSGGGCSGTGSCTVSMSAARTVSASFSPATYTLTVNKSGSGTVSSSPGGISCGSDCSESYNTGSSVTLTATPASGYNFSGWSGSGISCSGTGSCTVSMSAARTVTATFTAVASYALTVNLSGSGSVSSSPAGISCGSDCSQSFSSGTSVTLTATPASGYTFSGWSGACSGTGTCSVSMTAARSVTATFATTSGGTPTSAYLVTWDAVSGSLTGYKLYYSTTPFGSSGVINSINVGNTTSYTFTPANVGLTVGATVYVAIAAVGSGSESPMSEVASFIVE